MARLRTALVLLLLGVAPALSAVLRCERVDSRSYGEDPVAAADARFAPLRVALAGVRRVGFRTDLLDAREQRTGVASARFLQAQYALAPIEVVSSDELDRVVGDFRVGGAALLERIEHFEIVRDLGGGLLLLAPRRE